VGWSGPAQRVLLVAAGLLLALTLAAARRAALTPPALPVADDPAIDLRLDLNAAAAAELEALPGVGPALAARILAHRGAHGPFRSVGDLANVPGIGEKLAARLRPLVTVPSGGAQ
jgi:competence protein ComEA